MRPCRAATARPSDLGEDLDGRAVLGDPGRADEDAAHRRALESPELHVGLEAVELAAEGVALGAHVHQSQMVAVEHDQTRAGAKNRPTRAASARSGPASPSRSTPRVIVVDSPPGITRAVEPLEVAVARGPRRVCGGGAQVRASIRSCASKPPCRARTPDQRHVLPAALGQKLLSLELRALEAVHRGPRPREASATRSGSCQ